MNFSLGQILKSIRSFWENLKKGTKIALISGAAAVVVIAVIAAVLLNMGNYTVLYSGLSNAEVGEISRKVTELGVTPRVESGGVIMVPQDKQASLLMTLAQEGYPKTALNYDIFSNNAGFMTTDYEKKRYLVFQLQDRLQDSIKTIEGVENAIVNISVPNSNDYVLKSDAVPSTASVVLSLKQGVELTQKQIKGIEQLVSKSVEGLKEENVAIVDGQGNILNQADETLAAAADSRIELENNISKTLETRILKLFLPLFGPDAVRVAVNTAVDISTSVKEGTTYTPVVGSNGVISSQETSKDSTTAGTGAAGVPGNATNTDGVPTYPQQNGTETGGGVLSETSNTNYLVNELKEQVQRQGYEIKDLSAAVLLGAKTLSEEQRQAYVKMVAAAAGISEDKIVVANAEFPGAAAAEEPTGTPAETGLFTKNNIMIFAASAVLMLSLFVIFAFLLARRRRKKQRQLEAEAETTLEEERFGTLEDLYRLTRDPEQMPAPIVLQESKAQATKKQVQELASTNPEIIAQLIRTWLREDEESV